MKYGLTWDTEKNPETIVEQTNNALPYLNEIEELTVKGTSTSHILIDGDNYPGLKILNQTHRNKIDIICIDPPYNTGHEFIYNDTRVDHEDEYRHSKWLNFMDKRMRLAYDLLKDDGIVYCFIGDDELANLTLMMDQIFGKRNRVSTMSRVCKAGSGFAKYLTPSCDYILVYAKDITNEHIFGFDRGEATETRSILGRAIIRPNNRFWIKCPDGSFIIPNGVEFPEVGHLNNIKSNGTDSIWSYAYPRVAEEMENGKLLFKKRTSPSTNCVNEKFEGAMWDVSRAKELNNIKKIPNFINDSSMLNSAGTKELKKLFKGNTVFDFPKPTALIKYLISIANKSSDITVLDFFGGSGTTAHAVMEMNEEDLGSRQSITIALNDPDDDANICTDVTYERLKKVVNNIKEKYDGQLDLTPAGDPTLKYLKVELTEDCGDSHRELVKEHNNTTINGN